MIITWAAGACVRGLISGFDNLTWPRRHLFQISFHLVFLGIYCYCLVLKYKKPEADLSSLFFTTRHLFLGVFSPAHAVIAMVQITSETGGKGEGVGAGNNAKWSFPAQRIQAKLPPSCRALREPLGTVNIWPSHHLFSQKRSLQINKDVWVRWVEDSVIIKMLYNHQITCICSYSVWRSKELILLA